MARRFLLLNRSLPSAPPRLRSLPSRAPFRAPRSLLARREAAQRLQAPGPMSVSEATGFPRDEADPRKRLSPAAGRNKQPILEVLQAHLPAAARAAAAGAADGAGASLDVLEIASGTGEHAAHFVSNLPVTSWQPTEYTGCASPLMAEQQLDDIFESILAFTEGLPNVRPPLSLDAAEQVSAPHPRTHFLFFVPSDTSVVGPAIAAETHVRFGWACVCMLPPQVWTTVGEPGVSFDAIVAVCRAKGPLVSACPSTCLRVSPRTV